jgi:glutamine amidotransferase
MIALLDMGIGNLSSVKSGFARAGAEAIIVSHGDEWDALIAKHPELTGVVLPGVGAFGDAMFQLRASGLLNVVRKAIRDGRPLLGICLGMQLLFSVSEEHGTHIGIGVFKGSIQRFSNDVKVPHMGWNSLQFVADHPLLTGVSPGDYVYFVHSYYAQLQAQTQLLAAAQYGNFTVPAVVGKDRVYGTQFHPEKSGAVGEHILYNYANICRDWQEQRGGQADDAR